MNRFFDSLSLWKSFYSRNLLPPEQWEVTLLEIKASRYGIHLSSTSGRRIKKMLCFSVKFTKL